MRIRRRPQAQAQLIPSPPHQTSDPSTAPPHPPPPANQNHWSPREKEDSVEEKKMKPEELHLRRPNVDLAEEPHPKGGSVVGRSTGTENAPGLVRGSGGAQRQGADGHGSLENGRHRDDYKWLVINAGEAHLVNGVVPVISPTAVVHAKEGIKSDGPKRRRGPAVLLEGSRCSRVNGRGWRCSQPTLVGYSLCEHHLGKGRQSRSANNAGGGRSAVGPKLGRTEPASSRKGAAATLAAFSPIPPSLGHV